MGNPAPSPSSAPVMQHSEIGVAQAVRQGQLQAAQEYLAKHGTLPPGIEPEIAAQLAPPGPAQPQGNNPLPNAMAFPDAKPDLVKQVMQQLNKGKGQ